MSRLNIDYSNSKIDDSYKSEIHWSIRTSTLVDVKIASIKCIIF